MAQVDVRSAKKSEQPVVEALLQLYLYDFTEFENLPINDRGRFDYPYLPHYWEDPSRYPFLFRHDGKLSGFALLRYDTDPVNGQQTMEMAEFFVLKNQRRQGIGEAAARRLFDLFPGKWVVRVLKSNRAAYSFWKQLISAYTKDQFMESDNQALVGGSYEFSFESQTDMEMPEDLDIDILDY
ncbi:MAG: GNAT family N-acetyltransferase [Pseudomonadales bacterium]|nr:GNAT family N-acetyltransferase [Pseudomonadales bacterium]